MGEEKSKKVKSEDSEGKKEEHPLVKKLKKEFGDYLLTVCQVEFTKEAEEELEEEELNVPKTEQEIIAVVNDLVEEEAEELMKDYEAEKARILPLSGLWQSCYDQKFELIRTISTPKTTKVLYDKGFVKGLVASEMLRKMSLGKLKRYILSMILFGSVSRGTMHADSDVDIAFVIDDTDVKKMGRDEVKARLRKMIHSMAAQTGFEFNIQVYLLTEFWKALRDTQPVIFSLVRDGVPLYDTGMFIPWRTLLKMGKMKPSPEAVDRFYRTGRLLIDDVKNSVKELVVERLFLAMFNPAQAACMLIGVPPTDANHTPKVFRKHFVKEMSLIEPKYADYLREVINYRKDVEHGEIKEITPEQFKTQFEHAVEFQDRIEELFEEIRENNIKESLEEAEEDCKEAIINALEVMGVEADEDNAVKLMKKKLLDKGLIIGDDYKFVAKKLKRAKKDFKKDLLTTEEAYAIEKEAKRFVKVMNNLAELHQLKETEKSKIHFTYDNKNGEVWILKNEAFIIKDLKQPAKEVVKAELKGDGTFKETEISNLKELKKSRKEMKNEDIVTTVKSETLESVEDYIGEELEFIFI